jgi:hypothetical protein
LVGQEVADVLGSTPSSVESALQRARTTLFAHRDEDCKGRVAIRAFLSEKYGQFRFYLQPTTANGQPAFAIYKRMPNVVAYGMASKCCCSKVD